MKKIILILAAAFLFFANQGVAQSPEHISADSNALGYALSHGTVHGSARYFFMATDNRSGLTDYYAQAIGAGLKYETKKWHGWKLALGGYFHTEITSSGLDKSDPLTGAPNRMEIGLFDVAQPSRRHALARLEEMYLEWKQGSWEIRTGKQFVNTPFLNLQDGRMRPSAVEGLWIRKQLKNAFRLEAAWLWRMSPRSTTSWYSPGLSVGLYPQGVSTNGTKSQYAGHISSKGIFLISASGKAGKFLRWQVWDMLMENMLHSALVQLDYKKMKTKGKYWLIAAQGIRQDAVHDGGNTDPLKTYADKGSKSWVFSGKAGLGNEHWEHSIQYTRITADGRYLMPREWGRDPFFTFLPRERNEGFGNLDAVMAMTSFKLPSKGWQASLALGYYDLPSVTNYRLNKYGMPSYYQVNADIRYRFHGQLQGFDVQLLLAAKKHMGTLPALMKYVISKVDMLNWNLVVNYGF